MGISESIHSPELQTPTVRANLGFPCGEDQEMPIRLEPISKVVHVIEGGLVQTANLQCHFDYA